MFLEKAEKFNLGQYFDRSHPDVREQLLGLYERTKETIAREKEINLEVVLLIGCLEVKNAAVNLGLGRRQDLAEKLGLTENKYWKRAQAGRVLMRHPEFIDLVIDGRTHVSHIALLSPKLTLANKAIFLEEISGKSEKAIRELVASVERDGTRKDTELTFDIRLTLTQSEMDLLKRAREVLSAQGKVPSDEEAVHKALEDLLEKRDPMRKAERAEARKQRKEAATSAPKETGEEIITEAGLPLEWPSLKTPGSQTAGASILASVPKATGEEINIGAMPHLESHSLMTKGSQTTDKEIIIEANLPLERPSLNTTGSQTTEALEITSAPKAVPTKKVRAYFPAEIVHLVYRLGGGKCTYVGADGNICGSTYTLQIDHIVPVALGGTTELSNARLLCRFHNLAEAERLLGNQVMAPFRYDCALV